MYSLSFLLLCHAYNSHIFSIYTSHTCFVFCKMVRYGSEWLLCTVNKRGRKSTSLTSDFNKFVKNSFFLLLLVSPISFWFQFRIQHLKKLIGVLSPVNHAFEKAGNKKTVGFNFYHTLQSGLLFFPLNTLTSKLCGCNLTEDHKAELMVLLL